MLLKKASHFRIQFASNLFIDQHNIPFHKLVKPHSKTGILALLGNIGHADMSKTYKFMSYCTSNWDKIFWVPGPHEITNHPGTEKLYYERIDECAELSSKFNGSVCILNQNDYDFPEYNLTIAGASLWTSHTSYMPSQPEHREVLISTAAYPFTHATPEIYTDWNIDDIDYFKHIVKYNYNKTIVFLTHHLPVPQLVNTYLRKSTYHRLALDVNNLEDSIGIPNTVWLSGATGSCSSGMFGSNASHKAFCAVNSCFEYPYLSTMKPNKNYNPEAYVELQVLS